MADRSGCQRLLPKTRDQHRIVSDQIGQDYLYCVRGLQEDVACFIDHAHAAMTQATLKLISIIKNRLAGYRRNCDLTIVGTVINFVRKTSPATWTLFHLDNSTGEFEQGSNRPGRLHVFECEVRLFRINLPGSTT